MSQGQHPSSWDCLSSGSWEEGHLQAKTKQQQQKEVQWQQSGAGKSVGGLFLSSISWYTAVFHYWPLQFYFPVLWPCSSPRFLDCSPLSHPFHAVTSVRMALKPPVFISLLNHSLSSCGLPVLSCLCGITSNAAEAVLDVPSPKCNSCWPSCPPFC